MSLLLVCAAFITWYVAGIPPAFVPVWFRVLLLVWVVVVGAGAVLALRAAGRRAAAGVSGERRRWPLRPRRWAVWASVGAQVVAMVALTFVVDGALPAWVLGPSPQVGVVSDLSFREAQGRRDVDRTRVWFQTSAGPAEAWAADPDYALETGWRIVYDPEHPQRVMAAEAWASARATPWRLPLAIALWLMAFMVPPTVGLVRSLRYGSLRPGRPIRQITRPRRAKVLSVQWTDGRTATYLETPGLTEALRHKVDTDGQPGVHMP